QIVEVIVAPMMMLMALVTACTGDEASPSRTVKLNVPSVVGVPDIAPVPASMESPGGRAPEEIDQAKGAVPPAPERIAEKAPPAAPSARVVVAIVRGALGGGVGEKTTSTQ